MDVGPKEVIKIFKFCATLRIMVEKSFYSGNYMKKIYHVGKNLANVPYLFSSALRDAGLPVELYIGSVSDVSQEPQKNDKWVHFSDNFFGKLRDFINLLSADCFQTYAGSSVYLQFIGKPFIIYATGSDLHELPYQKSITGRLMKRSLKFALKVLFSNVHLILDIEQLNLSDKARFIPQPLYIIKSNKNITNVEEKPLFICPSRIDFAVKGQDMVLRAFSEYKKRGNAGTLWMFDWGPDAEKAKKDFSGIRWIEFKKPVRRNELLEMYTAADVVIDQFKLGALGLTSLEAMACGKPVIGYANTELYRRTYGEKPPILNARSEQEILEAMEKENKREATGKKAQIWIKKYHDPKKIAKKLISIYEEIGWMG
jgi:glycosyltransferase involved in cell wall biosynthesis